MVQRMTSINSQRDLIPFADICVAGTQPARPSVTTLNRHEPSHVIRSG